MSLFFSDQAGIFDNDKRKVRFDQDQFSAEDGESKNKSKQFGLKY